MLRTLVLLCAAPLAAGSALFWVSEPTLPGETLLIGGACGSKVELRQGGSSATWTAAPLVPSGTTPYGCAVQLPATFAAGEFQVRSDGGAALTGNVARPWFVFGDAGNSATSGGTGWMRVVGEALALERGATVRRADPRAEGHRGGHAPPGEGCRPGARRPYTMARGLLRAGHPRARPV